ncbi:cathepsin C [Acrasis kona]|uniref:Dipeptidyl peptidase 1 n=1 Tax=Acrasis kona TaxID=1008807 RepID=A0AAW2YIS7_9EUKA
MKLTNAVFVLLLFVCAVRADLPVHCLYATTKGQWRLDLTSQNYDNSIVKKYTIKDNITPVKSLKIDLQVPNVVTDENGNKGTWTLIYDQGFEVILNNNKYFAYFNYTTEGTKVVSNCHNTFTGWYHEIGVSAKKWGAFRAVKIDGPTPRPHVYDSVQSSPSDVVSFNTIDEKFVNTINSVQKQWEATVYPCYKYLTKYQANMMAGTVIPKFKADAHKNHVANMQKYQVKSSNENIPKEFDWRNVDGTSFVSPVRSQGSCGSCYAFASTAMFEARMRVASKNKRQPVYSPQEIVSCSSYSQGCSGGFPYLISKYAEDYGVVEESCVPYVARDTNCTRVSCDRTHFTDIEYIGGYYGATTAEAMQKNILKYGPIAVSIQAYRDLFAYKKGVYYHVQTNDPEPFFITNHVVLIVGWGEDNGTPYWIVKNSWGENFGLGGYVNFLRGTNECSIESLVPTTVPVL